MSVRSMDSRIQDRSSVADVKPKLMDQLRQALRSRHYSRRTEQTYCIWVKRFIRFHNVPVGNGHPVPYHNRHGRGVRDEQERLPVVYKQRTKKSRSSIPKGA